MGFGDMDSSLYLLFKAIRQQSTVALSDGEALPRIADEGAVEGAQLSGLPTVVLRLAAIYGPGRGVRERLKAGTYKLVDEGAHMFSRVHVDDVVGIILAAADRAPNPAVYCVADDRPTTQKEYADWLVARLGVPAPPTVASLAPGMPRRPVRNRAVANARLKRELDYVFRYPTFVEGETAIEAETGASASASASANASANANANAKVEPPVDPRARLAELESRWRELRLSERRDADFDAARLTALLEVLQNLEGKKS